jgi:two-component system, cell cycle response regulator
MPARLLVIEDNAANLELMTYLLNAFGHATETARDGEEGLAKARGSQFDLVICDIQLPTLDGFEVARALKGSPGGAPPLVAVTAFAQVGDREKLLASGFEGYISKPIVPEAFVRQIEAFLDARQRSAGQPAAQGAGAERPQSFTAARTASILCVDNVVPNLDLLRSLLEPFGYRVRVAHDVAQALAALGEEKFDLAICDLHLSDGTAYDLLGALRATGRLAEVPVFILSSTGRGQEERARAIGLGACRFVVRPIDAPALLAQIQDCLRPA